MKHFLREPLVQFFLMGALLFALFAVVGDRDTDRAGEIVVTRGQVQRLIIGFARTWQRPPTEQELNGLIEDHIREEILYREAVALGLDQDDTIVHRRLRQKLEFLTEEQAAAPTDEELQAYLDRHAADYREEPQVAFEHILFNRARRGKSAAADAKRLLAQLNGPRGSGVDLDTAGDPSLLPIEMEAAPISVIARLSGDNFSRQLLEVEPARWTGPIESSYGLHLVRVRERTSGKLPELASVRDAVRRDVLTARRKQALDAAYATLRQRYSVAVESPVAQVANAR